jgi:hypothetical protein
LSGANTPLRGRIFLRKRLLRPSRCAPERSPRGPAKQGSGSGGDAGDRARILSVAYSPLRGRIFLRKTLLRPSRCAPERNPRGPAKQGSGSGGDAGDRARILSVAYSPLRGRIFLRKTLLRPSRSTRVVAFRASHPAKLTSRSPRLVEGLLKTQLASGAFRYKKQYLPQS